MEKINLLMEKADVTEEEAKAVLEEAKGDVLDAILLLERRGKVKMSQQAQEQPEAQKQPETIAETVQDVVHETVQETVQEEKIPVESMVEEKTQEENPVEILEVKQEEDETMKDEAAKEQTRKAKEHGKFREGLRRFFGVLCHNSFRVEKDGKCVVSMPIWGFAIIFLFATKVVALAMIVGLFFGLRYFFEGRDDLQKANDIMDKASDMAGQMKAEFSR